MIAYLDASALVKRYVEERGSAETAAFSAAAELTATSIVSRAEVAAALARAARSGVLSTSQARRVQRAFARDWPDLARVAVSEALIARAESLAWEHGLRGYDAVQMASALVWQEAVGAPVVLATFDRELWEAAGRANVAVWPETLA